MCDPYQIFVWFAYGHRSVLWWGDKIPRGKFWWFSSPLTVHCTAQHFRPIRKRLNQSRCFWGLWLRWALGTMCLMGDSIYQAEGAILEENVATHCKVIWHSTVRCAKTTEPIKMPFWLGGFSEPCIRWGVDPQGERAILGVVQAISKHQQSSLQHRCKMDHSVTNNVVQQNGSFSMPSKYK